MLLNQPSHDRAIADTEVMPAGAVRRGRVIVTIDEEGRQTVVKTGMMFPSEVDFADGGGTRWLGAYRGDGSEIFDSYTCKSVRALNAPETVSEDNGKFAGWRKKWK